MASSSNVGWSVWALAVFNTLGFVVGLVWGQQDLAIFIVVAVISAAILIVSPLVVGKWIDERQAYGLILASSFGVFVAFALGFHLLF